MTGTKKPMALLFEHVAQRPLGEIIAAECPHCGTVHCLSARRLNALSPAQAHVAVHCGTALGCRGTITVAGSLEQQTALPATKPIEPYGPLKADSAAIHPKYRPRADRRRRLAEWELIYPALRKVQPASVSAAYVRLFGLQPKRATAHGPCVYGWGEIQAVLDFFKESPS